MWVFYMFDDLVSVRFEERDVFVPKKIIPAHFEKKNVYIARDSKEFDCAKDCLEYEKTLVVNPSRVMQTRVDTSVQDFDYESTVTLYYIRNDEDIDLLEWYGGSLNFSDFCDFGKGWYIYLEIDQGDYPDCRKLINLDNYISERRVALNKWESKVYQLIVDKVNNWEGDDFYG